MSSETKTFEDVPYTQEDAAEVWRVFDNHGQLERRSNLGPDFLKKEPSKEDLRDIASRRPGPINENKMDLIRRKYVRGLEGIKYQLDGEDTSRGDVLDVHVGPGYQTGNIILRANIFAPWEKVAGQPLEEHIRDILAENDGPYLDRERPADIEYGNLGKIRVPRDYKPESLDETVEAAVNRASKVPPAVMD